MNASKREIDGSKAKYELTHVAVHSNGETPNSNQTGGLWTETVRKVGGHSRFSGRSKSKSR